MLVLACISTDGARPTITTGASIYPAVQNLMLAARALGVGSCITTIHKYRDPQVKELLGIPAEVDARAHPHGLSAGEVWRPPRRPIAEVAHADSWGQAF